MESSEVVEYKPSDSSKYIKILIGCNIAIILLCIASLIFFVHRYRDDGRKRADIEEFYDELSSIGSDIKSISNKLSEQTHENYTNNKEIAVDDEFVDADEVEDNSEDLKNLIRLQSVILTGKDCTNELAALEESARYSDNLDKIKALGSYKEKKFPSNLGLYLELRKYETQLSGNEPKQSDKSLGNISGLIKIKKISDTPSSSVDIIGDKLRNDDLEGAESVYDAMNQDAKDLTREWKEKLDNVIKIRRDIEDILRKY